jgi:uncharacterized membrane protein
MSPEKIPTVFPFIGVVCLIAVLFFRLSLLLRLSVSVLFFIVLVGLLALVSGFAGDHIIANWVNRFSDQKLGIATECPEKVLTCQLDSAHPCF